MSSSSPWHASSPLVSVEVQELGSSSRSQTRTITTGSTMHWFSSILFFSAVTLVLSQTPAGPGLPVLTTSLGDPSSTNQPEIIYNNPDPGPGGSKEVPGNYTSLNAIRVNSPSFKLSLSTQNATAGGRNLTAVCWYPVSVCVYINDFDFGPVCTDGILGICEGTARSPLWLSCCNGCPSSRAFDMMKGVRPLQLSTASYSLPSNLALLFFLKLALHLLSRLLIFSPLCLLTIGIGILRHLSSCSILCDILLCDYLFCRVSKSTMAHHRCFGQRNDILWHSSHSRHDHDLVWLSNGKYGLLCRLRYPDLFGLHRGPIDDLGTSGQTVEHKRAGRYLCSRSHSFLGWHDLRRHI